MNSQFNSQLTFWKRWFGAELPALETLFLVPVANNAFQHKEGERLLPGILQVVLCSFYECF